MHALSGRGNTPRTLVPGPNPSGFHGSRRPSSIVLRPAGTRWPVPVIAGLLLAIAAPAEAFQKKYTSAREAFGVAAAHYNERNLAAATEPFEAALEMTDDDAMKLRINRALMDCYRRQDDVGKMFTAAEYVVTNSKHPAERSLTRTALMAFIHQRGKEELAVQRYESQLEADAENRTALYLLGEVYGRLQDEPAKAVGIRERLAALDAKRNMPPEVSEQAELARQYVRARKPKQGAELYETIAPLDPTLAAWHWKEAASTWLAAGDKPRALAAARKADESPGEKRGDSLEHYWHRALGDVYLATGEPKLAIPHYEAALAKTAIEGYRKDVKAALEEATKKAATE